MSCYILLLAFTSCSSCKKNEPPKPEDTLPPATQTGANTFGCVINGQAWIPNGVSTIPVIKPIYGGYLAENIGRPKYTFNIRTNSDRNSLELYVRSVVSPGRYQLAFDTGIFGTLSPKNYGLYSIDGATTDDPDYDYITTSQITGYVDFTVADTLNKRAAGTFEFDAIDNPSGKTIKITGGRFDINQKTLNP